MVRLPPSPFQAFSLCPAAPQARVEGARVPGNQGPAGYGAEWLEDAANPDQLRPLNLRHQSRLAIFKAQAGRCRAHVARLQNEAREDAARGGAKPGLIRRETPNLSHLAVRIKSDLSEELDVASAALRNGREI
ncbi:hypothetical protein MRS44_000400 [Fusarium solani]|uniref:uncharacterized protein n=1 Tax=Fusarium solani TaxID=169388 RepID=UPI0032C414BD|nr:hypothetical protein MRS44_000400 [Fusarium solani]